MAQAKKTGGDKGGVADRMREQNTREAFAAMRKAARARDLSEVMHVQGDYLREQGSRSMAQAREVGEMIANFGRDTLNRMTGRDEDKK